MTNIPSVSTFNRRAPHSVLAHPSMMRDDEKRILYNLARRHFTGRGVIIDAGLFLGASTVAFGRGIKDSGIETDIPKPIFSYDVARWVPAMDRYLTHPNVMRALGRAPQHHASYEKLLRRCISRYADLVKLNIGPIENAGRCDHEVEIAFYDCIKTEERDRAAFKAFGPSYIPGSTIIVQQDYFFRGAPDLKIRQEFLSPHFDFIGQSHSSAIFRLRSTIPHEYFKKDPLRELSTDDKVALLRQAVKRAKGYRSKIEVLLSIAQVLKKAKRRSSAKKCIAKCRDLLNKMSGADYRKAAVVINDVETKLALGD